MSDYSKSKLGVKSNFPENAVDAEESKRYEPILTAKLLKSRYLFGISLMSPLLNPLTKKYDVMTDDDLLDRIQGAISQVETEMHIDITPVKRDEGHPFDRNLLQQYGYMRTEHKPVMSVDKLAIRPGNNEDIYVVPNDWISPANFTKGQINIVPLVPAGSQSFINAATGSGAVFLQVISGYGWVPVFWVLSYTTGFADGRVPRVINDLIGCYAAIEVLSLMATLNRTNSHNLSLDGMSQSVSTAGPDIYNTRIKMLEDKKKTLTGKLKTMFGLKFVMTNI